MAVAVASPPAASPARRALRLDPGGFNRPERPRAARLLSLATAGAVALCLTYPALEVARLAVALPPVGGKGLPAAVATACYLPLHIRHVLYALRGSRPPGVRWTLPALAVVIVGALPVLGVGWLSSLHAIAVSVLILLPPRWALVIVAALVVAPVPLAFALGNADYGPFYAVAVAWRSATEFVVLWLIRAVHHLEAARRTLADEAVTRERLRIDDELWRTLGVALAGIAGRADRLGAVVERSPDTAEGELRGLVDRSRRTHADARRLASGYRRVSLRAELDTAAALLAAAGIETRVVIDGDPSEADQEALRPALRSVTAQLLREGAARSWVLAVVREHGRARLDLRPAGAGTAGTASREGMPP